MGTIVTPDVRILIKAKIETANLFYLLEVGGQPLDVGPAVIDYETTGDLIPSFATFYVRHLETALTRGVPRAYRETQERLAGIRGRVDLPAQLRRRAPALRDARGVFHLTGRRGLPACGEPARDTPIAG